MIKNTSIAENVYFRRAAPGEGGTRGEAVGGPGGTFLRCVVLFEEFETKYLPCQVQECASSNVPSVPSVTEALTHFAFEKLE